MVQEQLICILTPCDDRVVRIVQSQATHLDTMFTDLGCIHFAAIALLPPQNEGGHPTLALELAVDPDVTHDDLVSRLLGGGFEVLWPIYGDCLHLAPGASELVKRTSLHRLLLGGLRGADGGFVGARDCTVGQVIAEAKLFEVARSKLQQSPPRKGDTRGDVAQTIAKWASASPRTCWAAERPQRSFWRRPWMSQPVRAFLVLTNLPLPGIPVPLPGIGLLAVLPAVLAALAFAGVVTLIPFLALVDSRQLLDSPLVFGEFASRSRLAVGFAVVLTLVAAAGLFYAVSAIRVVTVAAFVVLLFGMIVGLLLLVFLPFVEVKTLLGFLGALEVLIRAGVLALLSYAALWTAIGVGFLVALLVTPPWLGLGGVAALTVLIVAAGGSAVHIALACLVAHGARVDLGLYRALNDNTLLGVPSLDVVVVALFLAFTLIGLLLARFVRLPPFAEHAKAKQLDELVSPGKPLSGGHQVHPMVVKCEGELARGQRVNHIFNLTDVKSPFWWNAFWLRYFLRLVSYLGHTVFTEGTLGNAEGIRFGHWYVIDGGRRLLFCSNYDGSFGGYLDEFINGASEGINLFWRWTELRERGAAAPGHPSVLKPRSFPPTKMWAFGGCKYEQWFKTYARDGMLPHLYRFEAYKQTAQDVRRAERVREAIAGARTPVRDDQLLRALES